MGDTIHATRRFMPGGPFICGILGKTHRPLPEQSKSHLETAERSFRELRNGSAFDQALRYGLRAQAALFFQVSFNGFRACVEHLKIEQFCLVGILCFL